MLQQKMAANTLAQDLTKGLLDQALEDKTHRNFLTQQYLCRYEMALQRAKHVKADSTTAAVDGDVQLRDILRWNPQPTVLYAPSPEMAELAEVSRWGQKFSMLVMQWLAMLKWPAQRETLSPPVGITWIELITNFLLTTQHTIPVKETNQDGSWRYICKETHPQYDFHNFNFGQVCLSFSGCIRHLQKLSDQQLIPSVETTLVRSICILGGGVYKTGYHMRPVLPMQDMTLQLVQTYVVEHLHGGKTIFDEIPVVPIQEPIITNDLVSKPDVCSKDIESRVKRWQKKPR